MESLPDPRGSQAPHQDTWVLSDCVAARLYLTGSLLTCWCMVTPLTLPVLNGSVQAPPARSFFVPVPFLKQRVTPTFSSFPLLFSTLKMKTVAGRELSL